MACSIAKRRINMLSDAWKAFLDRTDIVGGDLEMQELGSYYRGPIKEIEVRGNFLYITCEWVAEMPTVLSDWTYLETVQPVVLNMVVVSPQDIGLDRVCFMLGTEPVVIFPVGGSKLESERVEGFPNRPPEELTIHLQEIILVRHGDVDDDHNLTTQGRSVIAETADIIRSLNGTSVVILSSDAKRCDASAAIIAKRLGLSHLIEPALSLQKANDREFGPLYRLIMDYEVGTEILVLVTHLPMCRRFPAFYVEKRFDLRYPIIEELESGHAVCIDAAGGVSLLR